MFFILTVALKNILIKEFEFFGLQNGDHCLCGNDDSNLIPTNIFECNTPCSGDANQLCGGSWRINIYKTSSSIRKLNKKLSD